MDGMNIYFFTSVSLNNFLFKHLDIKNPLGLAGACLIVFFATGLFESLKLVKMYIELKIKQNPLTYGLTEFSAGDRTNLLAPLMIPSNMKKIASIRLKFHFLGCMMHMIYLFFAYIIMLIFMTYSVWLGLSIVLGSGAGSFIFGALGQQLTKKYAKMTTPKSRCTARTDSSTINPTATDEPCHM